MIITLCIMQVSPVFAVETELYDSEAEERDSTEESVDNISNTDDKSAEHTEESQENRDIEYDVSSEPEEDGVSESDQSNVSEEDKADLSETSENSSIMREDEDQENAFNMLLSEVEENINSEAEYDGYIFKTKESDSLYSMRLLDTADGIEKILYADDLYTADSLEDVKEFADCIEYIEPNYIVRLFDDDMRAVNTQVSASDNDEHLSLMKADIVRDEYGISGVDFDTETDMGGDGNPMDQIVIAVIDSGLDTDHEDIDYTHILEGQSFVSTATTADTMGHGTFVTGEIAAVANNGIGIDGIADDFFIMPIKVFSSRTAANSIIINAINYATEQKTKFDESHGSQGTNICVINMSLGSEASSSAMKDSIDKAIEAGIIVICAAGNDEDDRASYPAQYAIGVGSTDKNGNRSYYSQILSEKNGAGWQNKVWVSAPGENYTSTWYTGEYYTGSGTSFSSPQVAALAAQAVSVKNNLQDFYTGQKDTDDIEITTNHQAFRYLLYNTAVRKSNGLTPARNGQDTYYGWGIVDFKKAIDTLTDFENKKGQPARVSFTVDNGAGTELSSDKNGLSISIKAYDEKGDLSSEDLECSRDGSYNLSIGSKYQYTISADKYTAVTDDFTMVLPERKIFVSMESISYQTNFVVRNTGGTLISNSRITVKREGGSAIKQESDGTFLTKNGNYTYEISAEGYFPQSGDFMINDAENDYPDQKNSIPVTLTGAEDICSVKFNITGTDDEPYAEVSVIDADGEVVSPYIDEAWKLIPGTYEYTAESDYYKSISGNFTITEEDKGSERIISDEMDQRLYWAFIDVMPLEVLEKQDTIINVSDDSGNLAEPFRGALGEYRIVNGDYSYEVKANGYKTARGSFTMEGKVLYVDVELEEGSDPIPDPDEGGGSDDTDDSGSTGNSGESGDSDDTSGSGGSGDSDGTGGSGGSGGSGGTGGSGGSGGSGGTDGSGGSGGSDKTDDNKPENPADSIDNNGSVDEPDNAGNTSEYKNVDIQYRELNDVASSDWFYRPVNYVMTIGLFQGISEDSFGPNQNMTRGMLVTVLYRMSKQTVSSVDMPFNDVAQNSYYADAVSWAYANGIVSGVSADSFAPNAQITKEQITVMLYNYAAWDKRNTAAVNIAAGSFIDFDEVSSYAKTSVSWAYENQIVNGNGQGYFKPKNNASRAEVASMMMNFTEKIL